MIDATLPFAEKKLIEIQGHRMAYMKALRSSSSTATRPRRISGAM
jgi:hypothetical protein